MRTEATFRSETILEAVARRTHVSSVEAHLSAAGIPDLNIHKSGKELWLELKVMKNHHVKMRPTQRKWHRERMEAGGKSWVAVLDPVNESVLVLRGGVAATLATDRASWEAASAIRTYSDNFSWLDLLLESSL